MDSRVESLFSSPTMSRSRALIQELMSICIPLQILGKLNARTTRSAIDQLSKLTSCLESAYDNGVEIPVNCLSVVMVHLTDILKENEPENIADQVMERMLLAMELLFREWWWSCDVPLWDQVFMLAGVVIGGPVGKGKKRERDDETKNAAINLLITLTRCRVEDDFNDTVKSAQSAKERFDDLVHHAQEAKLIPIVGKTLDSLIATSVSEHKPLQQASLTLLDTILSHYMPHDVVPTVLPGVVSTMVRISLGQRDGMSKSKGLANGKVVASALQVLTIAVVRGMGDDVCVEAGIVSEAKSLEDLFELNTEATSNRNRHTESQRSMQPFITQRTQSWLRGSSSQLLVALNSLTPLVKHPSPVAQCGLVNMSTTVLTSLRLTLPEARPLLLSFLLSLSTAHFDEVSQLSKESLLTLLTPPSKVRHDVLQTLVRATADNLSALPRLLLSRSDSRIEHTSAQIEAMCLLPFAGDANSAEESSAKSAMSAIRSGVGKLLGPLGHIEKWGWSLLNVLVFMAPPVSATNTLPLTIESSLEFADYVVFPYASLQHLTSRSTQTALERMLRALGRAGGEECLFAVEWFVNVGTRGYGRDHGSASALWCACRLLEGIAGISLQPDEADASSSKASNGLQSRGKKVERFARWLAKHISDLWDRSDDGIDPSNISDQNVDGVSKPALDDDTLPLIEFSKGLAPLKTELNFKAKPRSTTHANSDHTFVLHKSFSLQLLCVSAAVLQARFTGLLIHAVYPLLRSFVSESHHLATTALSSLQYITNCTGYATPSNLLLSNFDYALDAVSRRLTRGCLDVEATKVLVVLVRLVGRDVVQRAGDVVEECFDRLDDFHGYTAIVEGIIEALLEVVKVVEPDEPAKSSGLFSTPTDADSNTRDSDRLDLFLDWIAHRHDTQEQEHGGVPHPKDSFGKEKEKDTESDENNRSNGQRDDPFADPQPTPTQALTKQIITRSLYFLTHGSAPIRARILTLLSSSVPVLPESALLLSVHKAWPFVLNRLDDPETYVVSTAVGLIEALSTHVGSFMTSRVWDDAWPRFRKMLQRLDKADRASALARRNAFNSYAGTESAYTHSHRLYRSMLRTMIAAVKGGVQIHDGKAWEVLIAFRRFLQKEAHEELQACAVELYVAFGENNADAVWLVLESTVGGIGGTPGDALLVHLRESRWDISHNVDIIIARLDGGI